MQRSERDSRAIKSVVVVGLTGVFGAVAQSAQSNPNGSDARYAAYKNRSQVTLHGIHRDFDSTHGDFGRIADDGSGRYAGIATDLLDPSGDPVFKSSGYLISSPATDASGRPIMSGRPYVETRPGDTAGVVASSAGGAVSSGASFAQWFKNTPGVNSSTPAPMTLGGSAGMYAYTGTLDGVNGQTDFDYTYEVNTTFIYESERDWFLSTGTNGDVWVYVDDRLVVDGGGGVGGTPASDGSEPGTSGSGTVAHWDFEGTGGIARDIAGTHHGTIHGATRVAGLHGNALRFDGLDDYVEVPHQDDLLLDGTTLSFWFNSETFSGQRGIFSKDHLSLGTGGHWTAMTDGTRLGMRLQTPSSSHWVYTPSTLQTGRWYHIVFSFGSAGMKMYLDGQLVDTDPAYTGGTGTTSGGPGNYEPLAFGANTWVSDVGAVTPLVHQFRGMIDEIRIYNTQLEDGNVEDVYVARGEVIDPPVAMTQRIDLDRLGWLRDGRTYDLRVFFANRTGTDTTFSLETNVTTLNLAAPPAFTKRD